MINLKRTIENIRFYNTNSQNLLVLGKDFYLKNGQIEQYDFDYKKTFILKNSIVTYELGSIGLFDFEKKEFAKTDIGNYFPFKRSENGVILTMPNHSREDYSSIAAMFEGEQLWSRKYSIGFNIVHIDNSIILILDKYSHRIKGNGVLNCLDLFSGEIKWKFDIFEHASLSIETNSNLHLSDPILIYEDHFYLKTNSNWFFKIHLESGNIIWKLKLDVASRTWRKSKSYIYLFNPSHKSLQIQKINLDNGTTDNPIELCKKTLSIYNASPSGFEIFENYLIWFDAKKFVIGVYDLIVNRNVYVYSMDKTDESSWQISDISLLNNEIYIVEYLEKSKNLRILEFPR